MGNLPSLFRSYIFEVITSRAKPKSATLQVWSSVINTFLAAKSRWIIWNDTMFNGLVIETDHGKSIVLKKFFLIKIGNRWKLEKLCLMAGRCASSWLHGMKVISSATSVMGQMLFVYPLTENFMKHVIRRTQTCSLRLILQSHRACRRRRRRRICLCAYVGFLKLNVQTFVSVHALI